MNSYYFNDRIFYLGRSVLIYCDTGDLVCDNEVFNIILRYLWLFVRGSGVCHRSDVLKSSLLFWNKYWYDVKRWDCLVIIFNWLVDFFWSKDLVLLSFNLLHFVSISFLFHLYYTPSPIVIDMYMHLFLSIWNLVFRHNGINHLANVNLLILNLLYRNAWQKLYSIFVSNRILLKLLYFINQVEFYVGKRYICLYNRFKILNKDGLGIYGGK